MSSPSAQPATPANKHSPDHGPEPSPYSSGNIAAEVAAELGLLALAAGTALSLIRVFDSWDFLSELAVPLLAAWLIALVLRRLHVGLLVSLGAQLLAGLVLLTAVFAAGTSTYLLPSRATLQLLSTNISASFSEFSQIVAPVPATQGFLFIIAVGFWLFVSFGDAAAFRFDGPAQAAIPFVITFLALGSLSRESPRSSSTMWFLAGLLMYIATQLCLRTARTRWDGAPSRNATAFVARSAVLIGGLALLGGVLLGPVLPGDSDPVVNLRKLGRGSEPRTVVSPFVGIRSLLGERSNTELFTVRADAPAYWRLTALEEFDPNRDIWISRGSYRRSSGELPSSLGATVSGAKLQQDFQIKDLAGLWLPGAYQPAQIASDTEVSFDRESSSIIVVSTDPNLKPTYRLDSLIPDFTAAPRQVAAGTAQPVDDVYYVKSQSPAITSELLAQIIAQGSTPFEQAIALQNWFRSEFRYDESVDFSQSADPLAEFLQAKSGFCQQFSSAFALFARALGLPSRVAVGFTPGDPISSASEPQENGPVSIEYSVRGRHAHAWPEIHFAGIGWVPFEPTPGRGDPQAIQYTGVAAAQALPPGTSQTGTTALSDGVATGGTSITASSSDTSPSDPTASGTTETKTTDTTSGSTPETAHAIKGLGPIRLAVIATLLAAVGLAAALTLARWSKRLRRRRSLERLRTAQGKALGLLDSAAVLDAWKRSILTLSLLGIRPELFETPTEFVARAADLLPTALRPNSKEKNSEQRNPASIPDSTSQAKIALTVLAHSETARRYSHREESTGLGIGAQAAADSVEQLIRYSSSGRRSLSLALALASLK